MKAATLDAQTKSRIKKIKILTRRLMASALCGDYLSAFKGSGLEFHQIRDYVPGDDVRAIDWNSFAKMNKIMIKQFVEERERTILLVFDLSSSTFFSSRQELKHDAMANMAATLAFVANENRDKVGAIFFAEEIEKWIPPSKGNVHLATIIQHIFEYKQMDKKTNLARALRFLISLKKRGAIVFFISDFIDTGSDWVDLFKIARKEYDLIAVRVTDTCEQALPDVGLLEVRDSESGSLITLDTKKGQHGVSYFLTKRMYEQKRLFEKLRVDLIDVVAGRPFLHDLAYFFKKRIRRQI